MVAGLMVAGLVVEAVGLVVVVAAEEMVDAP